MAHIIFKKQPRKIEYFTRRSISLPINALKAIRENDKVIIEIYSSKLPPEDKVNMPEKIIVEMTGKEFLNKADKKNEYYFIINC